MKRKRPILIPLLLILVYNSYSQSADYRDSFTGIFEGTVYYYEYGFPDHDVKDTIVGTITVENFEGFSVDGKSNFVDIEHKVKITYNTINPYDSIYKCTGPYFIFDGYIHPTIDSLGILTYPELVSCTTGPDYQQNKGYLNGFISSDSIKIEFGRSNKWGGVIRRIVGKRIATDISESQSPKLFLYPNPASDYIVLSNLNNQNHIAIYSIEGKIMYSSLYISEEKISISSFPKGLYFVKVLGTNGSKTLKLVKN